MHDLEHPLCAACIPFVCSPYFCHSRSMACIVRFWSRPRGGRRSICTKGRTTNETYSTAECVHATVFNGNVSLQRCAAAAAVRGAVVCRKERKTVCAVCPSAWGPDAPATIGLLIAFFYRHTVKSAEFSHREWVRSFFLALDFSRTGRCSECPGGVFGAYPWSKALRLCTYI